MTVYTAIEAQRQWESLLDRASREGEVRIKREDGQEFIVRPARNRPSPLEVAGHDLGLTVEDIVAAVREGRER